MPALASPQLWGWIAIALAAGLLVGLRHLCHAYVAGSLYSGK
jgi:hypothetical protein